MCRGEGRRITHMDEVVIHPLRALFVQPSLRVECVAVGAEEVWVSVDNPEVHAEEGLDGRVSQSIYHCAGWISLRLRESIVREW
jgi:hypothetical protein